MIALEEVSQVLGPMAIIDLAAKRMKRYAARDAAYDVLNLYYFGEDLSEDTIGILANNSQGRPLLRDLEKHKAGGQIYSAQRLAPIVEDYQALIGRMPNSRIEPPDATPEGEAHADKATKFIISTHELSEMDRQQNEAGFHLSGLGDACYLLGVDADLRRVVWEVVHPRTAYPEFYRGYKRFQVASLVTRTIEDPDVIDRDYRVKVKNDDPKNCAVTVYTSPFQRTVVIGTEPRDLHLGPEVEWDLGFCPAQWVFNKVNGGFAQSDISQSLSQQDFMDYAYNILIDGLVRNTYGAIVSIKNPQQVDQQQILIGPGAPPVMLQDDGAVMVTQIGGDVAPAMKMIDHTQADMNATSGTSQVRQEGQMHGSVQTGRAIHAAQGPQGTRIDLKQVNLSSAMRGANAMTIEMQLKAPSLGPSHRFEIFGRYKGKAFSGDISGEDLLWGSEGDKKRPWTRNTVTWDTMIGLNLQQKEQIATQGVMSELWDDIHARELVGVDDPIGMRQRVEAMKLGRAKVEAEVQQAMQGGGGQPGAGGPGGQPGPPHPGGPPPGSPGGGAPQGAPPSMIKRPMGMGQAPPPAPASAAQAGAPPAAPPQPAGPNPMGVDRKTVEDALKTIASKLKGGVYAVGDLAFTGAARKLQIVLEDHRDYALVLQTLKPLAPGVKVEAIGKKEMPVEAVRVA